MEIRSIFINRHDEVRVGWRALLFVLLAVALVIVLSGPLVFMNALTTFSTGLVTGIGVLLASFIATRYLNHKPLTAIGLSLHPSMAREFGFGCLVGALMITGVFLAEVSLGYVAYVSRGVYAYQVPWIVISSLGTFAVGAFSEEATFRGYLFQTFIQGVTFLPATIILALLFALAHAGNPNVSALGLVNIALAGVLYSFAYMKTRSLWLPFGLHVSWNFAQTTIYSFPTSGGPFIEYKLLILTQTGPAWLTGGAFGPEGGALATAALVGGTWAVLKLRLTPPEGIITLDSVEDLLGPRTEDAEQIVQHGGNGRGT
jgi:membrane protease YdiL (CAAX protease family)